MIIRYPDSGKGPFPALLLLHGMLAWKEGDGYMFARMADKLADNGIASARIDFCSLGENRCSRRHYGLKIMVRETACAFEWLAQDDLIDPDRIGLLGHSLGGRVAFLSTDLPSRCLVSLNGVINVDEPWQRGYDREYMDRNGFILHETSDGRTELLFERFFEELHDCISSDIYDYHKPILVCVGRNDPTLDPEISYGFMRKCQDNAELLVIEEANHTFNAKTGDYTKLYELCDKLNRWLDINLK